MNVGFYNLQGAAIGMKTGQASCNPGKPGYTMAGPPYGFQLELSWVGLRSLKILLLRSDFKTVGLKTD